MNRLEAVAAVCLDEHLRCVLAEREGCVEGVQLREGRALNIDCIYIYIYIYICIQGEAKEAAVKRRESRGEEGQVWCLMRVCVCDALRPNVCRKMDIVARVSWR